MKRLFVLSAVVASAFLACSQTPTSQIRSLGAFEFTFDLEKKTVQVAPKLQPQAVLTPTQINFTPGTLGFLAAPASGVNYISATFNVNNSTAGSLSDVTLIAYQKTGNRADTALKSLVDFNGTPLTSAQLDAFARAVQPINMPTGVAPFTVNDNVADLQYFNESELTSLETAADAAGELSLASNEYLFPYGFVARSSNISRSIGVGSNQGTVTIALKLPNSNEPTSGVTPTTYPRRFNMTFVAMDVPITARMSESYEERRGTSSAATRAANVTGFGIPSTNLASNSAVNPSSGIQINGVRTAGSKINLKHVLGERAWQLGSTGYDEALGTDTDSSGNVYVTGATNAGLDGQTNAGFYDMFLTKYNSSGVKQWTQLLGTTSDDYGNAVSVDSSNNIVVTGYTGGGIDGNTSAGSSDMFVTKYSPSGATLWTKQLGTFEPDRGNGVATDPSGNVYVAGYTDGGIDGQTNAGMLPFIGSDMFVTKYNSSGTKQWTRQLGTSSLDQGYAISADSSGNVYVTGTTGGNLDGQTSLGPNDAFLTKYDTNGVKQWTTLFGSTQIDYALATATDPSGNIVVTGFTSGNVDGTNAGSLDMFVSKINSSSGAVIWSRQLGTTAVEYGWGISTDSSGDIYVTGDTGGGIDGNTSAGGDDLFMTKYSSAGVKQWTRQVGTAGNDRSSAVTVDSSGNIFAAGYSYGAFGGIAANAGLSDMLLLRFDALTNIYK